MNVQAKTRAVCKKEKCGVRFIQKSKTNLYCPKCHKETVKYRKVNDTSRHSAGNFLNRYREGNL